MKNMRKPIVGLFLFAFALISIQVSILTISEKNDNQSNTFLAQNQGNSISLSDLDYITTNNWSYNGWTGHEIQKDRNQDGGTIRLRTNGEIRSYSKGIGLHAKGQVTYDISAYSKNFPRFVAKIGVDSSRGTNGSIWFQISVSNDGKSWTSLLKTQQMTGSSEAIDVDLNVAGYQYLRIYVDPIGSNAADHGSIADARLVTNDYLVDAAFYDKLQRIEYYDAILSTYDVEYNYQNNYRLVLERELVRKLGYWNIQDLAEYNTNIRTTLDWILSNNEVLEQVIEVGEIADTNKFLEVLGNLYLQYKDDLRTSNGYVYQKMMIGLAAAYSTDLLISPLSFGFPTPNYDYVERFALMKQLFDQHQLKRVKTNALAGEFVENEWFKDYHVQLMRMVMQDATSNIDLIWLNGYTNEKQSLSFYMIPYISPNYNQTRFYDEANKELYNQKYFLSKYNVPYGIRVQRYWMVIEGGGICWNASRFGQSMNRVNGIPATGAYQPGHELYIHYYQDENGNGYWTPRYGNWGNAGSTWGGSNRYRYLFDWGNKYFADQKISGSKGGTSTGYLYLGQANLNHYDQYKKSLYYNLIANSYTDNQKKLDTYFKALEVNHLNLDSYDSIISLYKNMSVKNDGGTITSHDWYLLSDKIIKSYTYYPVAMYDLLKVIRPYLDGSDRLDIDRLEKEALTSAASATANETIQVDAVRTHARQLLGKAQSDPITFSFDGDNAGKIVKNPNYSLAYGYSLDGGVTFSDYTMDDSITLSEDELTHITAENDIIIRFMGLTYTFRIDITTGTIGDNLFANDLENRVVGVTLIHEWKNNENDEWTSYHDASPNNTGNKTLYVRKRATGTQLPSDVSIYQFTEDNQPNTRKYVSVAHLSIHDVSTQATNNAGSASYAIDGNYKTRYHSAWNGTDEKRFVTIKLDKPRYVSAVEFVPAGGGNGKIYDGTIWGSTDGENWVPLARKTGLTYSNAADTVEQAIANTKSFEIDNPQEVQYIKIVADRTNGNWFTARAFNIYQDLTKSPRPTAGIGYSTTEPTTENVIARLVNVSVNQYEILSPGGDTHVFTENNQEFTFRFKDLETGIEGSAVAKVDWIDRIPPTATIEYSTLSPTNSSVFATLKPSEKVTVTNNGNYRIDADGHVTNEDGDVLEGYTVDKNGDVKDADGNVIGNMNTFTYEFLSNGEFTFEFIDRAGNKGNAVAKVDWIDHDIPEATLTYNRKELTAQDVTVTIDFDEDAIVTNNNGCKTYTFKKNGEFTFQYEDKAGNAGSITAKVDWIDKEVPTAEIEYDKSSTDKAIVRIVNPSKEIIFKEGNGVYEFTKNGNYEIIFYDQLGNKGKVLAIVDWLKSEEPIYPDKPVNPSVPDDKPEIPDKPVHPSVPDNPNIPVTPSHPSKPNTGNTISGNNNQSSNTVTIPSEEPNSDETPSIEEEKPSVTPDNEENNKPTPKPDNSTSNDNRGNEIVEDKKENNFVIPVAAVTVGVLALGFFVSKIK